MSVTCRQLSWRRPCSESPELRQLPSQSTDFILQSSVKRIEEEVVTSSPVYAKDTGYPWERRERGITSGMWVPCGLYGSCLPKRKSVCNQQWSVLTGSIQQKDASPGRRGAPPGGLFLGPGRLPQWGGRSHCPSAAFTSSKSFMSSWLSVF